jgi:hypothetical protein
MKANRQTGSYARKHRSTEAQKHRSTEAQKHRSTEAQKHRSTEAQKYKKARKHRGAQADKRRQALTRRADGQARGSQAKEGSHAMCVTVPTHSTTTCAGDRPNVRDAARRTENSPWPTQRQQTRPLTKRPTLEILAAMVPGMGPLFASVTTGSTMPGVAPTRNSVGLVCLPPGLAGGCRFCACAWKVAGARGQRHTKKQLGSWGHCAAPRSQPRTHARPPLVP